jgi:CDGSH-type Zn-finger protein
MTGTRVRTVYRQRKDGDVVVVPPSNEMKIACCDCGLVHRLEFAVVTHKRVRRVAFRATRDSRATAQRRRRLAP